MWKALFTIVSILLIVVAIGALWIFQGPNIALYVDRYGIAETAAQPVTSVRYEGSGAGGLLYVNQARLSLDGTVPPLQAPSIGSTKEGKLGIAAGGKVFPLGELAETADDTTDKLAAAPDQGDSARLIIGHSKLSWPTPFEMNFMTGASPSWKRYSYQRLSWSKANGAKLEMLWRYQQHFLNPHGWTSATMTRENQTGLERLEISP